jgi:hypothetical protein
LNISTWATSVHIFARPRNSSHSMEKVLKFFYRLHTYADFAKKTATGMLNNICLNFTRKSREQTIGNPQDPAVAFVSSRYIFCKPIPAPRIPLACISILQGCSPLTPNVLLFPGESYNPTACRNLWGLFWAGLLSTSPQY